MIPGWRLAALVVLAAAVAWVAGILLLGAVVAPAVFAHAPPRGMDYDRLTAGAVFGDVLAGWRGAVQICWAALSIGMLGAALLAWGARRRVLGVTALVLWLAVAVAHLVAQAGIGEAARALEDIRAGGPEAPALRQRFDSELHPRSTRLLGIEAVLVAVTGLAAAWVLVRRERTLVGPHRVPMGAELVPPQAVAGPAGASGQRSASAAPQAEGRGAREAGPAAEG